MLELDLILEPFVVNVYRTLPADQQAVFARLLSCEDQDLFAWLLHRQEPDDCELVSIVSLIREHIALV